MSSDTSAKDSAIRTSQLGSSSPRAPWQLTSPTSTPNSGSAPGCSSPRRPLATPDAYPVTWLGPSKSSSPKCEWGSQRSIPSWAWPQLDTLLSEYGSDGRMRDAKADADMQVIYQLRTAWQLL